MSKTTLLFDLMTYVKIKRHFTAEDVANEFNISTRTAYRYLTELSEMGVPIYSEHGRHGGYRILDNSLLPPISFNENEAFAIFFAFQSLRYYTSLPFDLDIQSVSRKLYTSLSTETQHHIEQLDSVLSFWNPKRALSSPFIKEIIQASIEKHSLDMTYQSKKQDSHREVNPIGLYAYDGFWYMLAYDSHYNELRVFRLDRILSLEDTGKKFTPVTTLKNWLGDRATSNTEEDLHLNVDLNREGIRQCVSQPWLEANITLIHEDSAHIDMQIAKEEVAFVANYFLLLGTNAKVKEPVEVVDYIRLELEQTLRHYS
ncbi:YafY family transcriptional regulator [Ruoffia tabacinasalis]|uniref:YafY family transcriptional regulator n=1 Tax=Ruoffia tabacinasalis TaxID=87458 RepID=A0A5R9DW17_9LACT|nr:YafY family protein [Ruoffia tabacinasalis]TLQ41751.1 YafY family transcriptional regulator [Ruoffia tabacinasalis]